MQENITSTLMTPRKPIKKLTQLTEKEKSHFLELFNTQSFKVTEKVDGMAFRMYFDDNELLFESAYSGLVKKEDFIFSDISEKIDSHCMIKGLFDYPIKLSGELLWNIETDSNKNGIQTFSPVCTKYTPSVSVTGSYFVIFDMYKVEHNKLVLISDSEFKQIMREIIISAGGDDVIQYVNGKALTYDFSDMKTTFFTSFISLLKTLERKVDSLKSHLCEDDINSPIEGIVITFDNGEQYGVFSSKYKAKKGSYYKYFNDAEEVEKEFKKSVYGYCTRSAIVKHAAHFNEGAVERYDAFKENTVELMKTLKAKLWESNIPKTSKKFQYVILNEKINRIENNYAISYIER